MGIYGVCGSIEVYIPNSGFRWRRVILFEVLKRQHLRGNFDTEKRYMRSRQVLSLLSLLVYEISYIKCFYTKKYSTFNIYDIYLFCL